MLEFLFYTTIVIIVLLLLAPFVLASMGIGILRHFSREMNDAKERKTRSSKSGFRWNTSRKSSTASSSSTTNKPKVFAEGEGTYVDFEEVKEGGR